MLIDKVDLYLFDSRRPPVEPKHLIRERDTLFGGDVVHLGTARAGALREVLGSQLLLKPRLERRDLLRGVFGHAALVVVEWIDHNTVLIARAVIIEMAVSFDPLGCCISRIEPAAHDATCKTRRRGGKLTQAFFGSLLSQA